MTKKLVTRREFATLAGVNPSTVTRISKTVLLAATHGDRIDSAHPAAVDYLEKRHKPKTPEPATGIDPEYEKALEFCKNSARFSISSIQRKFKIGYCRAKRIIDTMKTNGLIPESCNPTTGKVPTTQELFASTPPITEYKEPAHIRGHAAAKETKKAVALAEANSRIADYTGQDMIYEVPEDIEAFADMTLRELTQRFGTDRAFIDWLKATKAIEDINEKRLKNAQTKGELISRVLVKDHVIDTFNSAHLRLMKDGAKSIAAGVVSKHAGGAALPEIEAFVSDIVGSFIKPIKNKISRVLKNA